MTVKSIYLKAAIFNIQDARVVNTPQRIIDRRFAHLIKGLFCHGVACWCEISLMCVALEMKACVLSMNALPPLLPPVYSSSVYHFHCVFIMMKKRKRGC